MSYIVPMKKPICINCPFRSLDSCTLIYLMSDKDSEVTVHVNEMTVSPNCPLIEIPTPHGRLIDKDKLRHELFVNFNGERIPFYDCDNFPTNIAYRDLHSILAEQKTVIEAEGSEE